MPVVEADFGGLMVRIEESAKYQELRLKHSALPHEATEDATVNATDREILALLAENNALTLDDLAAMTGKHRATVARRIKSMKDAGVLDRVGSDKDGHWEIVG